MKRWLSLLLALTMLLAMASTASAAEITDLNTYETTNQEMQHFNIFYSQSKTELDVLSNCIDGLLTNDSHGNLVANSAKEWYSEDGGKTWTFILADGQTWFDKDGNYKADVVAEDWLYGLEWVLNFAKNDAVNTSMPIEMIQGAKEYYQYTKELYETDPEACMNLGLDKFKEMVGVSAPDDKTLIYTCVDKLAYFPTLATYSCLYPLSGKLLEELGTEGYKAVTWETLWYNGPYTITSFVQGNEKVLTASPNYWNAANVKRFNTITIKMLESDDTAYTMFLTGEIDNVTLTQSNLSTIYNNESNEFHNNLVESRQDKYTYLMQFNFTKYNPDGTLDENWNKAVNNSAFRKAWLYGLDWTPYLARYNAVNPLACQVFTFTANGVAKMSDGRDYTDVVLEKMGLSYSDQTYNRYDPEKAAAYKQQAMEELTAQGVTFPVVVDYYIKGDNQTAKDTADTLAQMLSDCLGDDFVTLNICTYVASSTTEVLEPGLASIVTPAWGADFGDPVNFLGQQVYNDDNALFAVDYGHYDGVTEENTETMEIFRKFADMVNTAKAITDDMDARYEAFADAEAYLLSEALLIPTYAEVSWQLTCVNDYSKIFAPYGNQSSRYINWETNSDIYTSDDYAQFRAAFNAE